MTQQDSFSFPILVRRPDEPVTHFQVFGDKNSGTNFARTLIGMNTETPYRPIYGWKHGIPAMAAFEPGALIVLLTRNAVDWAKGMYRQPHRNLPEDGDMPFSDFIRSEWHSSVGRKPLRNWTKKWAVSAEEGFAHRELQLDRHPITGKRYADIFEMRRVKLAAMIGMRHRGVNFALARFEDVRAAPLGFVEALGQAFDLPMLPEPSLPLKKVSPTRNSRRIATTPETLAPDDMAYLLARLDPDVEAQAGYAYGPDGSPRLL
ncbi:hypothetical protein PSA7680_03279 [Pseudoruegeria aquimaris]|uniref:Sulfotransferase family protein n=1 Tax=Pseudoruegeria aquimaris TaxID=393663 RepID=A0A1Y5THT0_9RHOB|nr:hypothetical protein [Pseudoruegeria aquimaris]SLN62399.1 hypothetical protein PSA7680_03279 [Pseudoruegeria aquimaris]